MTRGFQDCSEKKTYLPSEHDGIKSYCLCPYFVRTEMTKDLDEERLVKKSGLRKLTVEEVGNVFTEALRQDIDGSVYLILPGMPALRVPNLNYVLFILVPLMKI